MWLFVGVNGVGKTTTIGKVGQRLADEGTSVVMAAGDTFRAAAAEQLGTWAERSGAELVRGAEGGDPSAVIFDGVAHAAASGADVVLADTAGRLHTKTNLMDELSKVRRVADKGEGTVTEVLLVLDATTGQNGLVQARQFTEAVELTGVVLTKLDGSAKGGIVFAIASELGIPVKLVGLGETAVDLVDFDADEFVDALVRLTSASSGPSSSARVRDPLSAPVGLRPHVRGTQRPIRRHLQGPPQPGRLTEPDVDEVLREIRLALLEADVNVGVVRNAPGPHPRAHGRRGALRGAERRPSRSSRSSTRS